MPMEAVTGNYTKQGSGSYQPRLIHIDKDTMGNLMGAAQHEAWKQLARKYKMIKLTGKSSELSRLAGDLARAWCWELIESKL